MKVCRRQFLLSSGTFFALGAFGEGFRLNRKIVIAHVSDVHVSTADKTGAIDRVVAEINADPEIDFVVVTGDLQNRGQLAEMQVARTWYDRIAKPKFVCPGNHEMQYAGSRENWRKTFGDLSRSGRCGEIPVYVVDSTPPGYVTSGFFRPDEMKCLTADLAKDKAKDAPFAVFLTHYSPTFECANWWLLPQAIQAAGVTNALILSGHIHRFMSWSWLGTLGFASRAVGGNKLHRDHPSAGYVRLTVGRDGHVTGEERIAGATTYPAEYDGFLMRGANKKTKNLSSPKFKPVPVPSGATDVAETGVFAYPSEPPPFTPDEQRFRKKIAKELAARHKQFSVSACCAILSDGDRLYVPGARGQLVVLNAKTHETIQSVSCGYSPFCDLKKTAAGLRVSLVEGRSFTLKGV